MKTLKRKISHILGSVLVVVLFSIPVFSIPVQAQVAAGDWANLIVQEGTWADVMTGHAVPAGLAEIDLEAFNEKEWKELCENLSETVRTSDGRTWEGSVQDIIYLAFFYPEQVRFKRANLPLFYDYAFGRNEEYRLMALAAIHAIGDFNTMANLAQRVRLERSPRVKRLAAAAVVDYFTKAKVEVAEPRAVQR